MLHSNRYGVELIFFFFHSVVISSVGCVCGGGGEIKKKKSFPQEYEEYTGCVRRPSNPQKKLIVTKGNDH